MATAALPDSVAARAHVEPFVHRTPLLASRTLDAETGLEVRLKAEVFQRTGAYKIRGPLNKFALMPEEQKRRAIEGSYNPTITSLYQDADVLKANPFFGKLFDSFANAVARPSGVVGPQYNRVSNAFWRATHDVLSGNSQPSERLGELALELKRLRARVRW